MKNFAKEVANKTLMTLEYHYFTHQDFEDGGSTFLNELNSLNVGSQDVICFYYTGHGYNDEGSNFPAFGLNTTYPLDWIHSQFKRKEARLTMTIYEACNWLEREHSQEIFAFNSNETLKLSKLFKSAKGEIKIASNTAGVRAYSYTKPAYGGLFTNTFLNTITDYLVGKDYESVTWDNIMHDTTKKTEYDAAQLGKNQVPYSYINVSYHATPTACGQTPKVRRLPDKW